MEWKSRHTKDEIARWGLRLSRVIESICNDLFRSHVSAAWIHLHANLKSEGLSLRSVTWPKPNDLDTLDYRLRQFSAQFTNLVFAPYLQLNLPMTFGMQLSFSYYAFIMIELSSGSRIIYIDNVAPVHDGIPFCQPCNMPFWKYESSEKIRASTHGNSICNIYAFGVKNVK